MRTNRLSCQVAALGLLLATALGACGEGSERSRGQTASTSPVSPSQTVPTASTTGRRAGVLDVKLPRDYGMFSKSGDRAVAQAVRRVRADVAAGASREAALEELAKRLDAIANRHREVTDTAVLEAIADQVDRIFEPAKYDPIDALDELLPY